MTIHEQDAPAQAPAEAPERRAAPRRARTRIVIVLERYALVLLLAGLVVFFSVLPASAETFPTWANARNILANESVIAIAALGALVPLVCHQLDVSVGAVLGLVTIAVASLSVRDGLPLGLCLALGLSIGAAVGAVSGTLIARFNTNSIVITLGMATLLAGIGSLWSDNQTILGVPAALTDFGSGRWLGLPQPLWLLAAVALVVAYLLRYTVFGRQLLSIGANPDAARLVGIPVARVKLLAFMLAGLLAAIAGVLQLARTGGATADIGDGYTLPALAAVFLGSTTIRPGRFTVAGTLVGVFFVAVSVNGLTHAGVEDWVEPVFNGAAVVIAVTLSAILVARRSGDQGA